MHLIIRRYALTESAVGHGYVPRNECARNGPHDVSHIYITKTAKTKPQSVYIHRAPERDVCQDKQEIVIDCK